MNNTLFYIFLRKDNSIKYSRDCKTARLQDCMTFNRSPITDYRSPVTDKNKRDLSPERLRDFQSFYMPG
jgi:hypothetical protein